MIASFRSTRKTFKNGNFYVSLFGELYATLTVSSTKNCTRSYSLRFPPIFSEKALASTEILCILQQCTNLHWSQLAQPLYHRFWGKSVEICLVRVTILRGNYDLCQAFYVCQRSDSLELSTSTTLYGRLG